MTDSNSNDFLNKLEAYSKRIKGKDIYLPLYRKFRIKPYIFWHPVLTFFVFAIIYQILFSAALAVFSLLQDFSMERVLILLELTLSLQLLMFSTGLALITAIGGFTIRRHLNYQWSEVRSEAK